MDMSVIQQHADMPFDRYPDGNAPALIIMTGVAGRRVSLGIAGIPPTMQSGWPYSLDKNLQSNNPLYLHQHLL
jgi:hypothetical protein